MGVRVTQYRWVSKEQRETEVTKEYRDAIDWRIEQRGNKEEMTLMILAQGDSGRSSRRAVAEYRDWDHVEAYDDDIEDDDD